ncbi:MAG TPA: NADH-ubiquinone oxidoreductase-F iron-sulfur binding region domain-containing protein [Spirochaetota bacterium]|nr:NADH-ubiquinone oxidoreductase-F iron-sulfur binding region domain-containing protein [Spirochaetota bacterium]HOL57641.1 NADH-ubiquinone oxidoreductase-F iron-sulfur binding region domain-containing protein [Spirochaetota bacterium]HPP05090.1 NADH-ubiquinone oxidoreductase-F iron-sulfur binding region domain-containing protein [Spirochaetota bacterium]
MRQIKNIKDLETIKKEVEQNESKYKYILNICGGAGCISSNCLKVKDAFEKAIEKYNLKDKVLLKITGCIGSCAIGPVAIIYPDRILYQKLQEEDAEKIVFSHFINGTFVRDLTYYDNHKKEYISKIDDIDYFKKQNKIVLRNCGITDCLSIEDYIAKNGYMAIAKILNGMSQEDVIKIVKDSGLRGRGGGGFPTGLKWELCKKNSATQKYIICNADEGDPGAFMDRSVLEGDPHSVLEGMMIGGYAIGATKGVIYVRAEYPLAIERLSIAIDQARKYGILGKNIFSSNFDFDVEIRIGAGAFVCGEETALIASVEGKRGEPTQKPPFPAEKGLFGKPTVINNVETFANIPAIILNGAEWFNKFGVKNNSGTKVFALAGDINNTGLVEVPMGTTLGEIIFDIGAGMKRNKKFKAAQTGGPSGGCITGDYLNTPVDYDSLKELGAIMGSGGLICMDEDKCMVDVARFFMEFVQEESCGKCFPCRVGTKRMLEILERITKGKGEEGDIELLENLGNMIKDAALCGLGQTAPNPVLSTIKYFREEYEEHIKNKKCRAGICSDLFISPCQNTCPAGINVPGYVSLIAAGRPEDAYDLIRKDNPFPSVCGRVCTHPCESKCRRGMLDEPVAIMDLKRYAADYVFKENKPRKDIVFPKNGKSIGIIGAGPSGLTCGYYLARLGYDITVYESQPVAGGVLAFGIPEYRLPKAILEREIKTIENVGVKILLNKEVGKDISFDELRKKHDAIYVATGTQFSKKINVEGEDLENIYHGLDFLKAVNFKKITKMDGIVAVIGGGNTAIDAARCAVRLGAKEVMIIYRRTIEDMPADKREIRDGIEEGIKIVELTAPVRFIGDKKVKEIECIKMELKGFDNQGRKKPYTLKGSEFKIKVDNVILAVSQYSDLPFIRKDEVQLTEWGTFIIEKDTMMTNIKGVFAGGDVVRGSDTVITAIADGKKAAINIDKFLGGKGILNTGEEIEIPKPTIDTEIVEHERFAMNYLKPEERMSNFKEVSLGFHKLNAIAEAMRCLRCDKRD